jgi:hypothetical protein
VDSIEEGWRAVATDSIEVPQWDRAVARRQYSEHSLMAGWQSSRTPASWMRNAKKPGLSVRQRWRDSKVGSGSAAFIDE